MEITVRLFASLAETAGAREVRLPDIPRSATVGDLAEAVFGRYPALSELRESVIYAVNSEYVRPDHPVRAGDEVALIPPVSGGASGRDADALYRISAEPLDIQALHDLVRADSSGAVSLFVGVVRASNQGRDVAYLEYDTYPAMGTKIMAQIGDEVRARWPITAIAMHHRIGRLEIGEASVAIAVAAAHRAEAIAGCHYAIDRLKAMVPIWKKEVWTDGAHWIEGSLTPRDEAAPSPEPAQS